MTYTHINIYLARIRRLLVSRQKVKQPEKKTELHKKVTYGHWVLRDAAGVNVKRRARTANSAANSLTKSLVG